MFFFRPVKSLEEGAKIMNVFIRAVESFDLI